MNQDLDRMKLALGSFAEGDARAFVALFADDITWTVQGNNTWSGSYRGKTNVLRFLRAVAAQMRAPVRLHATRVLAAGDHVIVEATGQAERTNGTRYDNAYCWVCRFESGQLRELVEYMDTHLTATVLDAAPADLRRD